MAEAKMYAAIYGLILRSDGKFLIVRRARHDSHPGRWEMPGGGLEEGEDPARGVQREIKEECHLDVEVLQPIVIKNLYYKSRTTQKMRHRLRIAYLAKLKNESQKIRLSKDHDAYQWVNLQTLPKKMLSDFMKDTLQHIHTHQHVIL